MISYKLITRTVITLLGSTAATLNAQTIAITGRSYRLKDHPTQSQEQKKSKSKSNEPFTAGGAS